MQNSKWIENMINEKQIFKKWKFSRITGIWKVFNSELKTCGKEANVKSPGKRKDSFILHKKIRNWKEEQERRNLSWGVEEEWIQKREMRKARCLGALTTAEHLWASCARRRHTAPQTWPPPWGRSGRTPRSRARSPGGPTCGGQTWCCWASQSARLPPLPAIIT